MSDDLRKIQMHIRKYQDAYVVLGTGVVIGLALGSVFRSKPKIDEAAIVYKWMEKQVNDGFNIYALTNEQKALWESCWNWVISESDRVNVPVPVAVETLCKAFAEGLPKIQPVA